MDLDAYVARHRPEWQRLEQLVRRADRPRRLRAEELDELVDLYQRVATHLSVIRTRSPDPGLVDALSGLVTRARAAVNGPRELRGSAVSRFLLITAPAAVWERRWWILGAAVGTCLIALALGVWIASDAQVAATLLPSEKVQALCTHDFAAYYSSNPAGSFAAEVWTHNVAIAAGAIALGGLAGLPTLYLLVENAANIGISGGYMASCGKTGEFFALILPHGLLELTAVFVAGGAGLRLGWRLIDPGPRRRVEALAIEGRAAVGLVLVMVLMLATSGILEAFLTPSPLPPPARLVIGTLVWLAFVVAGVVLGRRAVAVGETGDLPEAERDLLPVAT